MGKRIIHCGPSGAGLGAKICNNLILGVEQIVVAEAMLLGQKLGLDPAMLAGVINSSTGGCWSSSVNNPVPSALPNQSPPCERDYEGGFATALMLKVWTNWGTLSPPFVFLIWLCRTWALQAVLRVASEHLSRSERQHRVFMQRLLNSNPSLHGRTSPQCTGTFIQWLLEAEKRTFRLIETNSISIIALAFEGLMIDNMAPSPNLDIYFRRQLRKPNRLQLTQPVAAVYVAPSCPMAASTKPNVIIFGQSFLECVLLQAVEGRFFLDQGGLNTYSRALAALLVPVEGESLVSVGLCTAARIH